MTSSDTKYTYNFAKEQSLLENFNHGFIQPEKVLLFVYVKLNNTLSFISLHGIFYFSIIPSRGRLRRSSSESEDEFEQRRAAIRENILITEHGRQRVLIQQSISLNNVARVLQVRIETAEERESRA